MPEDKICKRIQPFKSSERKKKKRNKATASTCAPENTEKPQAESLPPEILPLSLLPPQSLGQSQDQLSNLRVSSKKNGERLAGLRCKKHRKDSPVMLMAIHKPYGSGHPMQGCVTELSVLQHYLPPQPIPESLRWEGVLQDPQAEAKRLEQYRANRRQRYIAHREALFKETQDALRQTFLKEKDAPAKSGQQETTSLLQLSRD